MLEVRDVALQEPLAPKTPKYLPVLAIALGFPVAFGQVWPSRIPTYGYAVYVLMTLVLLGVAVVLWVRAPRSAVSSRWLRWFLVAVVVTWVWAAAVQALHGEADARSALILLLIVYMVYAKQPSFNEVRQAMAWTAVIDAVSVWVNWTLSQRDLQPSDWLTHDNELCRSIHRAPIIPFVGGQDWGGPYAHGNILGEVGAYIVFFGIPQRGPLRVFLVASGAYFVAISRSETAVLGFMAGLAVILVFWVYRTRSRAVSQVVTFAFAGIGTALGVAYVIINPTLSERTYGWPGLLEAWRESPLVGVPQTLIVRLVAEGQLPAWAAMHAHNMWIDTLVRAGIVGALLALSVMVVAAVITIRAGKVGFSVGAALLTSMLVFGLAEKVFSWGDSPGVVFFLMLAVLGSAAWLRERDAPSAPAPQNANLVS